jgi:hypothetical protein
MVKSKIIPFQSKLFNFSLFVVTYNKQTSQKFDHANSVTVLRKSIDLAYKVHIGVLDF